MLAFSLLYLGITMEKYVSHILGNITDITDITLIWKDRNVNSALSSGTRGSVAEWSKALVLGTSLNEAWVRIPPLPETFYAVLSTSPIGLPLPTLYTTTKLRYEANCI